MRLYLGGMKSVTHEIISKFPFIEQITNRTDDQRISSLVVSHIRIANEFITV